MVLLRLLITTLLSAAYGVEPVRWTPAAEMAANLALDHYFSAKSPSDQRNALRELAQTPLRRTQRELEAMRGTVPADGFIRHAAVPWLPGHARGWYNLSLPKDYAPTKSWPLILALHGMPSDGDNLVIPYHQYFRDHGFLVLYPNTLGADSLWPKPDEQRELLRLLGMFCRKYRVDPSRIACTGASGGGIGTWSYIVEQPALFNAAISFSAMGTIFDDRLKRIAQTPFYVHHGAEDPIRHESVEKSIALAKTLGIAITYYLSPGTGHSPPQGDFDRAFDWLLKQPAKPASPIALIEGDPDGLPIGYAKSLPFAAAPNEVVNLTLEAREALAGWTIPAKAEGDDLVAGLLQIAAMIDPKLDVKAARASISVKLAELSSGLKDLPPSEAIDELTLRFFDGGLVRDSHDPLGLDPNGWSLPRTLERKLGQIPVLVGWYVAAAQQAGLPVYAVVTPYHSFARFDDGTTRMNIELSEAGARFSDAVYGTGYALAALPALAELKQSGSKKLLAACWAGVSQIAGMGGRTDMRTASANLALALDGNCLPVALATAREAQPKAGNDPIFRTLSDVATKWPKYAAVGDLQGDLYQRVGNERKALTCYLAAAAAPLIVGDEAVFSSELQFKIASIYAVRAKRGESLVSSVNNFNKAIVACLQSNPQHKEARQLLESMGGRFVAPGP